MSLANTISAPVAKPIASNEVLTNLTRDRAGLTLYSGTGRCFGDDDDTTYLYWAKTFTEANERFKHQMLIEDGNDEEEAQAIIDGDKNATDDSGKQPWGFINDTTPICEMSDDGKTVLFHDGAN